MNITKLKNTPQLQTVNGNPNNNLSLSPSPGTILYRRDTGWLYKAVRGGFFSGNADTVFTSVFGQRDPNELSTCWAVETEFIQNPTAPYALVSERNNGVGLAIIVQSTGTVEVSIRINTTQAYAVTFQPKLGLGPQRIVASWNHLTQTLIAWCGFEKTVRTTLSSLGGTVTSRVIEARNSGIHRTPFYVRIIESCDEATLDSWVKYGSPLNLSQADIVYDMSKATLSGNRIPNFGSAGDSFTLTDNTPGTWDSDYWAMYQGLQIPTFLTLADPYTTGPTAAKNLRVIDSTNNRAYIGRYVADFNGLDVIQMQPYGTFNAVSMFASYRLVTIGAGSTYNIRYRPLSKTEFSFIDRLENNRSSLSWVQGPADGSGIAFSGLPIIDLGTTKRIAMTLGGSGVGRCIVNGVYVERSIAGNTIVPGTGIASGSGNVEYQYVAICEVEATEQQLRDWDEFGILPCEPVLVFNPDKVFPTASNEIPNLGSAGGTMTITDGSPAAMQKIAWVQENLPN